MALDDHIRGLKEAKAAFNAVPVVFRERMGDASETTARETARAAQNKLAASPSIRTRRLYSAVMWTMSRRTGRARVGISNIRFPGTKGVDAPARRAHFVEFGTRDMAAEPFMIPAAEGQKQPYLARAHAAGKIAERDLAAGRFL